MNLYLLQLSKKNVIILLGQGDGKTGNIHCINATEINKNCSFIKLFIYSTTLYYLLSASHYVRH